MTDTVKHKFTSAKADGADATLVRKTNWNDEHAFAGGSSDGEALLWKSSESDKVAWKLAFPTQTFRGLHLRTHPDADKALYQVMLVHADEIVMDDGTRVSDWDRLTADITVAGAGGLDTGAEAASTWYEVYAIRKSSDGTKNLLLHRHRDMTSEAAQQFTTADDAQRSLRLATGTPTDKISQGFQVGTAGAIDFVDVYLLRFGTVSGRIWFTIEGDSGGNPDGTPLATSDKLDASTISTTKQYLRVPFRDPYTAATATQYHLVMQGDYTRSDANVIGWRGVAAGGYASGSAREYTGAAWNAASGVGDFNFFVYTRRNEAAVTMPSGYDQKALVGYAFNDSGSNLKAFVAHDKYVRWIGPKSDYNLTSLTLTRPWLTGIVAFAPTIPIKLWAAGCASTSNVGLSVGGVPSGYATEATWNIYGGANLVSAGAGDNPINAFTAPITTEYQGVYVVVSTGAQTGYFYLPAWEW